MHRLLCPLLALLLCAVTTRAEAPPDAFAQRVYLGHGETLTISPAQPLSWKAHVGEFAYQPGSLEAAYTGLQTDGDTVTQFVRLVGLKRGETGTLLSATGPVNMVETPFPYTLSGWSGDGRYLLTSHDEWVRLADGTGFDSHRVWDSIDVGASPFKVRRIPLPDQSGADSVPLGEFVPSPSGKLFAIQWRLRNADAASTLRVAFLYDPARDTLRRMTLPANTLDLEWLDDTHLTLEVLVKHAHTFLSHDIVTDEEKPATRKFAEPVSVPRAYPELRLSMSITPLDVPGPNPQSRTDGGSLWLNVAGARPKLPSRCLATFTGHLDPQPTLAPDQSSALWLEHGALFGAKFAITDASVWEKYDAGEPLSCEEEREIAQSNAKQIGLGLMQYVQDYDEQYPPAENFKGGVMPYIKNDALLSVGNVPFSYAAPADLSMEHMDDVTRTVLGTFALPCATVTLYADGHVKLLPPPAAPAAP